MAPSAKHIALICNPTADNKKALQVADAIVPLLNQKNISHSLFTQYWPQVWEGFTEAWIIGGDGTVNYFINQYPFFHLPLAVFAGGTGNDLHHMLYNDMELAKQVTTVLQATPQLIDAGLCNEKLFLNGVGIGFDGAIVQHLLGKKKRPGKASYLLSVLKHIFQYRETNATCTLRDQTTTQETFMISIANGKRYGGGFVVTPKASVQDGLLDVMMVSKINAATRLRYLPYIERGEHVHLPFVQYHHAAKVIIETATPVHAHMDGEYFMASRFEVHCLPHQFSFLL